LPKLQAQFKNNQLVFLVGSDSLAQMADWPQIDLLLANSEVVVGLREGADQEDQKNLVASLPSQPLAMHVIDSYAPSVSSTKIRQALRTQAETDGILASVRRYSNQHWLYISLV
jgi:nicotinic acid mononucleotide adenylyltransferase